MSPAAVRDDPDGHNLDLQIERHMGCMAGFLQLFNRPQILAGKRIYASKRISSAAGSTSPSERSDASFSSSSFKPCPSPEESPSSPESGSTAHVKTPMPIFDSKDGMRSSWKMREAPRLSLDSRAVVDGKGKLRVSGNRPGATEDNRRSPGVVARLMGLDALPGGGGDGDAASHAELRRSASESRISRDLSHFRFVDPSFFQKHSLLPEFSSDLEAEPPRPPPRAPFAGVAQRKRFFDAQDFYPEPKLAGSLYGEIDRRLRMRGINEPARDLETLKQVLEVLQLKGLLHERRQQDSGPPIVVMKPSRPPRRPMREPSSLHSRPARRNVGIETDSPTARTRVETEQRNPRRRSPRPPDCNARSSISSARRRQVNAVPAPPLPPRRSPVVSTSDSPRTSPRRNAPQQLAVRSPRNRRSTATVNPPPVEDDDGSSTTVSGSISKSIDYERMEYRSGRSLLERCDKLLHSIAAVTSSPATAADQQPSPVSVLDSSFLGEESSPSPITPRSIDFKDQSSELEDDAWLMADLDGHVAGDVEMDGDYVYVAAILRGTLNRRWDPSDVYSRLENRYQKGADVAGTSRLHRRMLFDTVVEVLDRKRSVHAWDAFKRRATASSGDGAARMREVWAEVRHAGERAEMVADNLNDVANGAMRKDMSSERARGWGEACPAEEMSEAVLYIERQIFKDLVGEAIRDLADVADNGTCRPRRKLLF